MPGRLDGASIRVDGLDELRKELRRLDDRGVAAGLKDANYAVAALVVDAAKARASTRMERAAAATLSPSRAAARAQVSAGGTKAPFFGGAEFGASHDRPRVTRRGTVTGWNQFPAWTGSGPTAGRFLYPAIRSHIDDIVETYGDAIEQLTAAAFPN